MTTNDETASLAVYQYPAHSYYLFCVVLLVSSDLLRKTVVKLTQYRG